MCGLEDDVNFYGYDEEENVIYLTHDPSESVNWHDKDDEWDEEDDDGWDEDEEDDPHENNYSNYDDEEDDEWDEGYVYDINSKPMDNDEEIPF